MGSVGIDRPELVDLASFDICSQCGFASADVVSLHHLNSYYKPWDELLIQLPSLLASKSFRSRARSLPLLTTAKLTSKAEKRRAYETLAYFTQAYVFEDTQEPDPVVPVSISEPFLDICSHWGLQPVLSHIGMCLWNWRLKENSDLSGESLPVASHEYIREVRHLLLEGNLDRFELYASFTGTHDEKIFSMVALLVEVEGGCMVQMLLDALHAASTNDLHFVTNTLKQCTETLERMHQDLQIMHDQCRPDVFYNQLRPLISGSKGLPNGFVFELSNGQRIPSKGVGASAGQSALFQFLDCVFGVEHDSSLLQEMQLYMPRSHRDFLTLMSQRPSLRTIVQAHPEDSELNAAFDACVAGLRAWRGKHVGLVMRYIMLPARKMMQQESDEADKKRGAGVQGTGGSLPMPFLKKVRDETV